MWYCVYVAPYGIPCTSVHCRRTVAYDGIPWRTMAYDGVRWSVNYGVGVYRSVVCIVTRSRTTLERRVHCATPYHAAPHSTALHLAVAQRTVASTDYDLAS